MRVIFIKLITIASISTSWGLLMAMHMEKNKMGQEQKGGGVDSALVGVMAFAEIDGPTSSQEEILEQERRISGLELDLDAARQKLANPTLSESEREALKEKISSLEEDIRYANEDLDDMHGKPIVLKGEFLNALASVLQDSADTQDKDKKLN